MAYSDKTNLDNVVPEAAQGWLFDPATVDADYPALAGPAAKEIDSLIGWGTATPPTDADTLAALAEVEVLLVCHRRLSALYAARDQAGADGFRADFRARAMGILNALIFPASASVPVALPGSSAHGGTLAVAVFEDFTAPARWLVRCTTAGTLTTAVLNVWNSRDDGGMPWKLATLPAWPERTGGADPKGLEFQVRLTLTGTPTFALGDGWTFRTFGQWSRTMHRGIRMVDTRRSGTGR